MSQARLVFTNTAAQVTGQVVGIFISLATFIFLARYLGAGSYGEYSIITTYLGFFAIAADWSLYLLIVKGLTTESDPSKQRKIFGEHVAFRLSIGIAALLIGVIAIWLFPYSALVKLGVVIGAVAFLSNSLSQLIYSIFQAHFKLYLTASLELLYKLLFLVAVVVVGLTGQGLLAVVIGMVAASVITLGIGSGIARKFLPIRAGDIRITLPAWKSIFRSSWALGINGIFSTVIFKIDILILSFFVAASVVGVYGLSSKIIELLAILSGAFVGSVFPIITKLHAAGSDRLPEMIRRSALVLLILAAFVGMFTFVMAKPIVLFAGGSEFESAVPALQILAFFPIFAFFGNYFYHLAVVFDQQNKIVWRTFAALILNVVLNLILIPRYGFIAAAWTTIATEIVGVILSGYIIYRAYPIMVVGPSIVGVGFSAIVTGSLLVYGLNAMSYFNGFTQLSTLVQVLSIGAVAVLGITLYILLLIASKTLQPQELTFLRRAS